MGNSIWLIKWWQRQWPWMALKVIQRLQTFSHAIRRTFVQHFTRFQLTVFSHGSSGLAELLVWDYDHKSRSDWSGFGERSKFISRSMHARTRVSLRSSYYLWYPGWQYPYDSNVLTPVTLKGRSNQRWFCQLHSRQVHLACKFGDRP